MAKDELDTIVEEMDRNRLTSTTIAQMFVDGTIDQVTGFTPPDPAEVARRIAERRAEATSFEELVGRGAEPTSGKNFKNKPFRPLRVEWQSSDIEGEGLPFYAVVHAVDPDGEALILTCGAKNVVQVLAISDARGWVGLQAPWLKFVGVKLDNGYEALELKSAEHDVPFAS